MKVFFVIIAIAVVAISVAGKSATEMVSAAAETRTAAIEEIFPQ
ncbi:hypothetical protein [Geoalkalibacter subterraneus]|nr:hypothetical protein [Geoalkalibacter subterraneus]